MSEQPVSASKGKVVAAFLAIYVIWGTTFLGIRIAVETIPPFMMAAARFMIAGGVMLPVMLARGVRFPKKVHWRSAFIVGGLMLAGGNGLLSFAEQRISSALAALVVAAMPMFVALLDWVLYKGKRPNMQTTVGLVIGFSGVALLFGPGAGTGNDLAGILIVLSGTALWAVGALYSRRAPLPEETLMGTAAEMLAGGFLLLLISIAVGEPARLDPAAVTTASLWALAYLTVFGSFIAYTAYIWLMKTVEPARVNTNFYVNPVIAVFAGGLVGGETITPLMVAAAAVILIGVAVINTKLPALKLFGKKSLPGSLSSE